MFFPGRLVRTVCVFLLYPPPSGSDFRRERVSWFSEAYDPKVFPVSKNGLFPTRF